MAEADRIFAADLAPFEAAVSAAVPASLTQNQFDACVSLAFNIGARGFQGSTVVHRLAAGDRAGAADAFLMWNHPPELAGRRRAERAQFLTPDAAPDGPKRPALAGPHLLPQPRPGLWARIVAALTRKAA
jgi:lysozyme